MATGRSSVSDIGVGARRRADATSKTLPAGAATAIVDTHYGPTETRLNPCPGGTTANQAGRPKTTTAADPDGTGPQLALVRETVYDAAGRTVATRTGPAGTGDLELTRFGGQLILGELGLPRFGGRPDGGGAGPHPPVRLGPVGRRP